MTAEAHGGAAPGLVTDLDVGGMRTLVRPSRATEVVAVRTYLRGGALHLDGATAGAQALYARAARRGTRRFPKDVLNAETARLGIDLGAAVGHDYTVFNLRCLRRHFDAAWDLYTDVLLDPLLAADEFEIVRSQTLVDIRQREDTPDGALVEMARRHVYDGHPYRHDPHGSAASVAEMSAAAVRAHMARALARGNLLVAAVGDLDPQDLAARIERRFAALPLAGPPLPAVPRLAFARGNVQVEPRDLPTQYVLGEFAAPSLGDPDYHAALLGLSVLRDRFFEEVRTKRNLSYAPSASLGHDAANLGSIYVTSVQPKAAMAVMRAEMRRIADVPLEAGELADKVRVFVTRYFLQNETHQAQAGFLASHELLAGGWERSLQFVERIEALTPDDIRRTMSGMLQRLQYVVLGDGATLDAADYIDP